jgi:hypothetical protein
VARVGTIAAHVATTAHGTTAHGTTAHGRIVRSHRPASVARVARPLSTEARAATTAHGTIGLIAIARRVRIVDPVAMTAASEPTAATGIARHRR